MRYVSCSPCLLPSSVIWVQWCDLARSVVNEKCADNIVRSVKPHLHDTTCCQTDLTTGCIVYTNIQPVVKPVRQPVWQPAVSCIQPVVVAVRSTRLSNRFDNRLYHLNKHPTGCQSRWMFVYMTQSVVKLVAQPDWQPVVACKWGIINS